MKKKKINKTASPGKVGHKRCIPLKAFARLAEEVCRSRKAEIGRAFTANGSFWIFVREKKAGVPARQS